jgi:hypothetical protein
MQLRPSQNRKGEVPFERTNKVVWMLAKRNAGKAVNKTQSCEKGKSDKHV